MKVEPYMLEPVDSNYEFHSGEFGPYSTGTKGLTKLEWMAGMAMTSISNCSDNCFSETDIKNLTMSRAIAVLAACHDEGKD